MLFLLNNDNPTSGSLYATSKINQENYTNYHNSSFGISLDYPIEWKQIGDNRGSWFRNENESVNVRIETIPFQNQTLDQLTNYQANLTEQQFPDQKILEKNVSKMGNNYTAYKLLFDFPEEPADPEGTPMRELKIWTTNNGRAYIFSYFTTNDAFDFYLPVVQKMIDSFRITVSP
jgi:eukaryotic-like serine/threonine-protein kinase